MIESVELRNFKCFKSQTVKLGPLTLLTGLNGMGKSTLIQSLLLLRQSAQNHMLPERGLMLNGHLVSLGMARDVLCEGAESDEIGISVRVPEGTYDWLFRYHDQYDDVLTTIGRPVQPPCIALFDREFHYLSAERLGPRTMHDMSSYAVEQEQQLGPDGRYAIAYLENHAVDDTAMELLYRTVDELRQANSKEPGSQAGRAVRFQVAAWLGEISPGSQLTVQPYPELNQIRLGIGFQDERVRSKAFTAPNVGFGLSYVLPVLVAILASTPGTLIIVENPESHLHPKGQVAMGRLLVHAAAAGMQVIAETHSDHVLNGVRLATKLKVVSPESVAIHYFRSAR